MVEAVLAVHMGILAFTMAAASFCVRVSSVLGEPEAMIMVPFSQSVDREAPPHEGKHTATTCT